MARSAKTTSFCLLSALLSCLVAGCGSGGPDDPASIQGLKDLGVLVVPNTDGQVNSVNMLPQDATKLTSAIELFSKLKLLKTIAVNPGVPLTDDHLASIGKNRNLVELNIDGAPITDAGVAHLTGCSKLESLSLIGTKVTSTCMADLGKLSSLNLLNLNGTTVDGGFEHLQKCEKLQWILIGGLTISDEQATNISKIPGITHITLSPETQVSDAGMKSLKSVPDCTVDTVGGAPPANTPAPE